jgi:hypothetical protein
VWFPLILGFSAASYHRASGLSTGAYLWRRLAVTGVLLAISAVSYAIRLRRISARPAASLQALTAARGGRALGGSASRIA